MCRPSIARRSCSRTAIKRMAALQELLYANKTWSLLVVFQAMDAAGKDSTIKHVMSGVNPQGVRVSSFKAPGPGEHRPRLPLEDPPRTCPSRGHDGHQSTARHYEEVLVARVHDGLVRDSGLPRGTSPPPTISGATASPYIAAFEAYLGRQGTRVVKFFLNVSKGEQKKRFLARSGDAREDLEVLVLRPRRTSTAGAKLPQGLPARADRGHGDSRGAVV